MGAGAEGGRVTMECGQREPRQDLSGMKAVGTLRAWGFP